MHHLGGHPDDAIHHLEQLEENIRTFADQSVYVRSYNAALAALRALRRAITPPVLHNLIETCVEYLEAQNRPLSHYSETERNAYENAVRTRRLGIQPLLDTWRRGE